MTKFEAGRKYSMRSTCDHECVWTYTVKARTAQTVTLVDEKGKETKCRISCCGTIEEMVRPLGKYSMCPILRASRAC